MTFILCVVCVCVYVWDNSISALTGSALLALLRAKGPVLPYLNLLSQGIVLAAGPAHGLLVLGQLGGLRKAKEKAGLWGSRWADRVDSGRMRAGGPCSGMWHYYLLTSCNQSGAPTMSKLGVLALVCLVSILVWTRRTRQGSQPFLTQPHQCSSLSPLE